MNAVLLKGVRAQATSALEALAAGDVRYAETLLDNIVRDVDAALFPRRGLRCGECGLVVRWPGELEAHERQVHAA